MAHRIAVIGQSNAILGHGFVNQLAARPEAELGNLARLGASPSVIVPAFGTVEFFRGHDFAIFDTAIVDQNFLWAGAVDLYSIARWLEQGIVAAHAAGCVPILLVIPHIGVLPAPGKPISAPLVQRLYRAIAARTGAACFDLYDAAARHVLHDPASRAILYQDNDHLAEGFVGEVVDRLLVFMNAWREAAPPTRRIARPFVRFEGVPLSSAPGARLSHLSSSLFADDFAEIAEGEMLSLPVGPSPRIAGLLVDRASSEGVVEIGGDIAVAKQIGMFRDSEHSFVAQLVPILSEMHDRNGAITLTAVLPDTPLDEPAFNARPGTRSSIRIARVLVERSPEIIEVEQPILPLSLRKTDWFQPL